VTAVRLDPVAWLRGVAPFPLLPEPLFEEGVRRLQVAFVPKGERIVAAGGEPLRHLWVIRAGAVRLERRGEVLQVLEEGELFGTTSLLTGRAIVDVVVEEPLLAYRVPAAGFERLLADARFAAHFAGSMTERLRASLEHAPVTTFQPDLAAPVEELVRRPAVWIAGGATIGDVARTMRDEGVSSVLVRGEPPGIVTDRDLRNRALGEELGPEAPADRVVSRPLSTVPAGTPVYEAWRVLLDAGVNHLPVVRAGEILGVVTSTALLRHSAHGPIAVMRRVERLASRADVSGYGARLAEMAAALLAAGLDAPGIAALVARLDDALLRRLLAWAEADLGPPPAPYAWLVGGAAGRREATLPAPRRDALVYADEGAADRAAWERLFERVRADLAEAGFPADGEARLGPASEWIRRVEAAADAAPHEVAALLDLRRAGGHLAPEPLYAALRRAGAEPRVSAALVAAALAHTPPALVLLRARGGSARVDLDREGLRPIVLLARALAAEARSAAGGTLDRLDALRAAGVLSAGERARVGEAFRFLSGLRLRQRLRGIAAGAAPAEPLVVRELTPLERTRLKESFRAIRAWQEAQAWRRAPAGAGA
jgi:CBS domain-containing protein